MDFADFGEIMWRLIATSGEAAWIRINRLVSRGLEKDTGSVCYL
jgi:hypothetical protein